MTWILVQKSSAEATATGTSITPSLPGGSAAGNLLTCTLIASVGTGTWSLPAGWVQGPQSANGGNLTTIWYYIGNPGSISSVVCTFSTTANIKGALAEFHTDISGTVVANASGTGSAGAVASCAVSTSTAALAGDLGVCVFDEHFTTSVAVTFTDPANWSLGNKDEAAGGNHHYSAYRVSCPAGTLAVTGSSNTASDSPYGWTGCVLTFTAQAAGPPSQTWVLTQKSAAEGTTALGATVTGTLPAASSGSTSRNHLVAAMLITSAVGTWSLPDGWQTAAHGAIGGETATVVYYLDTAAGVGTSTVFTYSVASNLKVVMAEFDPGLDGVTITLNASGQNTAGAVAQCTVTTGSAAAAGDLGLCCFIEHFTAATAMTWTDPAGWTLLGKDEASAGNHLYAAWLPAAALGALTVTGKSDTASTSPYGWAGAACTFTATTAASGLRWGAFLNYAAMGYTSFQTAAAGWAGWTSRPLRATSFYLYSIPASLAADARLQYCADNTISVYLSMHPAVPGTTSDRSALDTFLASCKAGGLDATIAIWHEPSWNGLTSTQYLTAVNYYGPTIRSYYPMAFWCSAYAMQVNSEGSYYQSGLFDAVTTDFYADHYFGDATRLDDAAALADGDGIAFGITEHNSALLGGGNWLTGDSTTFEGGTADWTGAGNCSVTQSTAYANTVHPNSTGASLDISCSGAGNAVAAHCLAANIAANGMPCSAGDQITTIVYIRSDGTHNRVIHCGAQFFDSSNNSIAPGQMFDSASITDSGTFQMVTGTVTAPAGAVHARACVQIVSPGAEHHYVDDAWLTDASVGQSQANATTFFTYVKNFMLARIAAGKKNAPCLLFNSDSSTPVNWHTNAIRGPSDYRVPLYQAEYDLGGGTPPGTAGHVGAYLNPSFLGGGTLQQAISTWTGWLQRPLTVRRVYYPFNATIPSGPTSDMLADGAAGRRICISFRPAYNPPNATDLAHLDTFLSACKTAGLDMAVAINSEAYVASQPGGATPGLTAAQNVASWRYYAPTIRQYYPTCYNTSSGGAVSHDEYGAWYPGAAYIDLHATDYYCSSWAGGQRLDGIAAHADAEGKPFGLWEYGTGTGQTQAQATSYFAYLSSFFTARLAAGKTNTDIMWFNSTGSGAAMSNPVTTGTDFRIPLMQDLFDALDGGTGPGPPAPVILGADLDLAVTVTATLVIVAPQPPGPPVPAAVTITTPWHFLYGPAAPDGGWTDEILQAQTRTFTMRAGAGNASEVNVDLNGADVRTSGIEELITDFTVLHGGNFLCRGRVGPSQDTLDGTQHRVQFTSLCYREVLRRRALLDPLTFTGSDPSFIGWSLVAKAQSYPGGNLGITRGLNPTIGFTEDYQAAVGDYIGNDIDTIAQMAPGGDVSGITIAGSFDWDIIPYGKTDLRFDVWPYARGTDKGVVLEYGGNMVASMTRTVDPSTYGNAVYVTGDTSVNLLAQQLDAANIATRPEGRWDLVIGTHLLVSGALSDAATWFLADGQVLTPSYSIVLRRGSWDGKDHIWIGDTVTVRLKSGRLAVNAKYQVQEMNFDVGPDGIETLTLTVGLIPLRLHRKINEMLRRLRKLEVR